MNGSVIPNPDPRQIPSQLGGECSRIQKRILLKFEKNFHGLCPKKNLLSFRFCWTGIKNSTKFLGYDPDSEDMHIYDQHNPYRINARCRRKGLKLSNKRNQIVGRFHWRKGCVSLQTPHCFNETVFCWWQDTAPSDLWEDCTYNGRQDIYQTKLIQSLRVQRPLQL